MCNNCSLHEEQATNWSKLTFLALLPPSPYLIPSPDSILPIPCLTFPIRNPKDRKLEYHDIRLYPNTYYIFKSCKEITFILTMQQIAQEYFQVFPFQTISPSISAFINSRKQIWLKHVYVICQTEKDHFRNSDFTHSKIWLTHTNKLAEFKELHGKLWQVLLTR